MTATTTNTQDQTQDSDAKTLEALENIKGLVLSYIAIGENHEAVFADMLPDLERRITAVKLLQEIG